MKLRPCIHCTSTLISISSLLHILSAFNYLIVRNVNEYLTVFTGIVLCSHSVLAVPFIIYNERGFTFSEIVANRVCFSLSYGLNLKIQSESSDTPAIVSNGGASRCQLMTDPTGYSVTRNCA